MGFCSSIGILRPSYDGNPATLGLFQTSETKSDLPKHPILDLLEQGNEAGGPANLSSDPVWGKVRFFPLEFNLR